MVSPSFIGMTLPAGDHFVTVEYRSTPIKTPLFFLGLIVLVAVPLARRDLPERLRSLRGRLDAWRRTVRSRFAA
jgi:hypothetical protein